jgi:hypothetical protein
MKPADQETKAIEEAPAWEPPLAWVSLSPENQAMLSRDIGEATRTSPIPSGIRDQYVADRFPGVAQCGQDLENVPLVIGAARLYFDEGKTDRALELLDLAVQQCPFDEALRLARLEIAFLLRDAPLYVVLAKEFQRVRGISLAWCEIARLGRALAPSEAIFGAKQGDRAFEHYGPWPQMPNWLNASWDLTPEVLAADYHRLMALRAPRYASQSLPLPPRTER